MDGFNVSDTLSDRYQVRLDDMRADAALDAVQATPIRDLSTVETWAHPFHGEIADGDVFSYPDDMAARRGWPVGGRVRWIGPRFEVVS